MLTALFKRLTVISTIVLSTTAYSSVNSMVCQISDLNILNDQVISGGESIVELTKISQPEKTPVEIKMVAVNITAISTSGKILNKDTYYEKLDLNNFSKMDLPSFQYFQLSIINNENGFSLKMTDDQTGDSHLTPIICKTK